MFFSSLFLFSVPAIQVKWCVFGLYDRRTKIRRSKYSKTVCGSVSCLANILQRNAFIPLVCWLANEFTRCHRFNWSKNIHTQCVSYSCIIRISSTVLHCALLCWMVISCSAFAYTLSAQAIHAHIRFSAVAVGAGGPRAFHTYVEPKIVWV